MAAPDPRPRTGTDTRRSVSRVEWTPTAKMTVDVLREGRDSLPACWADLSISGVMLILPLDAGTCFSVGDALEMLFELDGYQFCLAGEVVWDVEDDTGRIQTCGVHFDHVDPRIGEDHPELWRYFNRRVSQRVLPPSGERIEVQVTSDAGTSPARMMDVSSTGIRLAFEPGRHDAAAIAGGLGHKYELELRLAADLPRVRLFARAERAVCEEGELRWGLTFLEEDAEPDSEALEVVEDFVRRHAVH